MDKTSFRQLQEKCVVNVCNGADLGRICDMELDLCTGVILSITVPAPTKCLGLIRDGDDRIIPYCQIKKFGADVILVEL